MTRTETIGDCTLYLGDCREILPNLPKVDAVVTDPPYGIGESSKRNRTRGRPTYKWRQAFSTDYKDGEWDKTPASPETILWIRENSRHQIIFGGNFYSLPPTSCWLVWDKKNGTNDFADCELAWTNLRKAVRRIEWLWNGMCREVPEARFHLTQKPLGVMKWCIEQLPSDCHTILDPFMGSGTTGVACVKLGRKFIGIEIEPKYFDTACRRIEEATRQPDMLVQLEKRAAEIQQTLDLPYDADDDIRKSVGEGLKAVKERMAKGGEPWPKPNS